MQLTAIIALSIFFCCLSAPLSANRSHKLRSGCWYYHIALNLNILLTCIPHKPPKKWFTLHFFRWFVGRCQSRCAVSNHITHKVRFSVWKLPEIRQNLILYPSYPLQRVLGLNKATACALIGTYWRKSSSCPDDFRKASPRDLHFSLATVTPPLSVSASLQNSVADAVTKQKFFSHPLLFILPRKAAVPFSYENSQQ